MWGIIPAAGAGSRIQPLAFSKELLPLCGADGDRRRPRAVSDFLVERMVRGGATHLCFVIGPAKSDILEYYGASAHSAALCYCVQPQPSGLCDSIFRALPFVDLASPVLIGLPDTIWFPADGLRELPDDRLAFLLFPVSQPERFDAVVLDGRRVIEVQVKQERPSTEWVWGAIKMPGVILSDLHDLWQQRGRADAYIGTLVNAWLARGGEAMGCPFGEAYFDAGTMEGYLEIMHVLSDSALATGVVR